MVLFHPMQPLWLVEVWFCSLLLSFIPIRAESYSVQTRTGPRTGANRPGLRSSKIGNSVLGPVQGGPVDRIRRSFFFCSFWHGRAFWHGQTMPKYWRVAWAGKKTRHGRARATPKNRVFRFPSFFSRVLPLSPHSPAPFLSDSASFRA